MLDSDAGVTVGQGVESNPMTEVGSPRKKCSAREDLRIDSVSCLPPDSVQRTRRNACPVGSRSSPRPGALGTGCVISDGCAGEAQQSGGWRQRSH